ncbi:MAG: aminotransferase class I/II-fold pyridoxal phosphate-dependent enzyme [Rickettsiales bacterium]|jgi:alanine-synthesizing transaminase|nr:aminotransferase class I/II-fold pyridoxal phosphate-dependent enzyme [Rickettsiales bacterium]
MQTRFHRLENLPSYVFAEINRLRHRARVKGLDVIDLGMGNPDGHPPEHVIEKLSETSTKLKVHGYSMSRGINGLRLAQSEYYARRFGVDVDPESEMIVTIGSKEGISALSLAITGPDDYFLVPSPAYPIHVWGPVIASGKVKTIRNLPEDNYLENLKSFLENAAIKPIAVIVNYPCNPTAEVVDLAFYEELVDICRAYQIYVISDLAYSEIYFGDNKPPSILQVKGAKDVAIEFTSLSKTYSMAGWRVGFAAGNKTLIAAITKMKSYLDYGIFTPIQIAATYAIRDCDDYIEENRKKYKERRDVLIQGLDQAGWNVTVPDASMFVWAKIPDKFSDLGSLAFSKLLLEKANVVVSPGIGFGVEGDGYVRISLVENVNRIRQATKNIKLLLKE